VRVLDLNHCELLQDTVVQAQLLLFEAGDHFVANVHREQVVELLVGQDLAIMSFHLVSHGADIIGILEQRGRSLLSLLHAVDILLSVALFALEASQFLLHLVAGVHRLSHRFNIVDFSLHPVVKLDVGVAQALARHLQGLAQFFGVRVVENQLVGVQVLVLHQVQLFVALRELCHFAVSLNRPLFGHKILGQVRLDFD